MSIPPTLLLADDSVTIQRVVALTFADQAVRVIVARDGQDAINRMARERPDLVLADTNMPCVDGYDLTRWVRQQPHLSAVPVLLLAGATDPVDEQRLHDSGANGVLEKPFEPSHVISRVKELLGMRGGSQPASSRLVTSPEPAPVDPRAAAPPPHRAGAPDATSLSTVPVDTSRPDTAAARAAPEVEDFGPPAPIDEMVEAYDRHAGDGDVRPTAGETPAGPDRPTDREHSRAGTPFRESEGWFSARPRERTTRKDGPEGPGFHGDKSPHSEPGSLDEFGPAGEPRAEPAPAPVRRQSGSVRVPLTPPPAAEVFETLLAAEQGDAAAAQAMSRAVVVQASAPEVTEEMLDMLATRVAQRVQAPIAATLREHVVRSVQDSMATEARAAVAEAVQAAVDGSILGTLRGSVNEAVAASMPTAIEQQIRGAIRESADRAMSGAVDQAVRETVAAQVATLVRDTVEREMRDGVAPLVQQVVRETVGATLQQVVADAVFAAVPPAVADAIRSEVAGQIRETVQQTAERLVREEIARIRQRRG